MRGCGSRRFIAPGRRWHLPATRQKTREHTDAGRLLYDQEKHASHRFIYGSHDPGACALLLGAWAEWLLGYPEKALASISPKGLILQTECSLERRFFVHHHKGMKKEPE